MENAETFAQQGHRDHQGELDTRVTRAIEEEWAKGDYKEWWDSLVELVSMDHQEYEEKKVSKETSGRRVSQGLEANQENLFPPPKW